jgi:hypothetical protein
VISNRIDLNIVRLNTYDDLEREIERYVEQVVAKNGPTPMDIGTLAKGDSKGKGEGKDKGEGKGKSYQASWSSTSGPTGSGKATGREQFQGNCSRCGKWGHKKADCYARGDVNGNVLMEKPAQPGNGTVGGSEGDRKGKGKQKGDVDEFAEVPESGEFPPGLQGQQGDVGMFFTLTEDERMEKKTAVYVPPHRREKAEGLAITQGQWRILTNELTVGEAIEERRLKDLIKASITEVSKQALTAKLETIQEEKEVLKQHKKEKEGEVRKYSLRYHQDVKAGVGVKMAKRKEASRRRMEQRRLRSIPEIVAEKVELEKVWREKHDTGRPEEQDYEVDDPDQAEFQEEIEGDVVMEVSRGNMKGEYRLKTMKAVQVKKNRKYRPLTEKELEDMISKEQGADDQVRPFKERSWVSRSPRTRRLSDLRSRKRSSRGLRKRKPGRSLASPGKNGRRVSRRNV